MAGQHNTREKQPLVWRASGAMVAPYVSVFLCFYQLCNSWRLHTFFMTVPKSLQSSPASQPMACPGRLDHRPVCIVGYWVPVTPKWAEVATPQRQH